MFGGKTIAVVMPAHDEAHMIMRAVTQVPEYVDDIVVVDDASTDATAEALPPFSERAGLHLIRHDRNRGVGSAIVTGYKRALELGAEFVAVMAGDAQMHPSDLPGLLEPLLQGRADYVKGDRLAWPGVIREMPLVRFIGNHGLSLLTRISSGYRGVRDSQCGYTAVTADVLMRLDLDALYHRYGFPNDMLAKLHAIGARVENVSVRPIYGQEVSGISLSTALFRVPMVLWRSYLWRLREERKIAGQLPAAPLNSADG
jgi:glycosyltransferase involved in cell wall biosynthesis